MIKPHNRLKTLILMFFILPFAVSAHADFQSMDKIAAIVEENVILESELDKRLRLLDSELSKSGQLIPDRDAFKKDILDQLILESIQLQLAKKHGIRVDDNSLHATMEKIAAQNNKSLADFRVMVEKEGLSYKDLRERIRRDLSISRLQQKVIANRINVTSQDVKNYLSSQKGKEQLSASYKVGHILIESSSTAEQRTEKEKLAKALVEKIQKGADFNKEAKKLGKNNDLGWRKPDQLPTLFSEQVITMQIGDTVGPIASASGFHIINLLDKKGGDHKVVDQTKVRHILIKPNEIRTQEDAHQMILDIREQIISGKSFKEMARTYSEDTISGTDGGDLGWSNPGDFVATFAAVMKQTKENEISEPFLSNFGWHILRVDGRRQQNIGKEFQLNQARVALQRQQFDEELALWLREIKQDAFVEIKQL